MGGVGGREENAGQATEVDSDAGFYGREGAISSMTAVNGEERNGVGVGIFDLERRWVSRMQRACVGALNLQSPAHLFPKRLSQLHPGLA